MRIFLRLEAPFTITLYINNGLGGCLRLKRAYHSITPPAPRIASVRIGLPAPRFRAAPIRGAGKGALVANGAADHPSPRFPIAAPAIAPSIHDRNTFPADK